ncbi:hypothetical protein DFS21_10988 [Pseudomonas sp. 2848]|nr:hypothetical protein DFS21_10988 [Pseudomonas sp. 2848]
MARHQRIENPIVELSQLFYWCFNQISIEYALPLLREDFVAKDGMTRLCTKSLETQVRQGENSRGSAVYWST